MTFDDAVRMAIEKGGYDSHWKDERGGDIGEKYDEVILLDRSFWQALGRSLGKHESNSTEVMGYWWKDTWHRFIDWIAEGNDVAEFFEHLLKE